VVSSGLAFLTCYALAEERRGSSLALSFAGSTVDGIRNV
jgi:hypothetical protein